MEELQKAEKQIVKYVQRNSFLGVIVALKSVDADKSRGTQRRNLKRSGSFGSIYKLSPILDVEGLLRVGGRIKHAPIDYESKHQLIMQHRHHATDLLLMQQHEAAGHMRQEYVLSPLTLLVPNLLITEIAH